ncbi:MAG: glycosyltransferase family 39 protein [Burkholderiales bacterium]|nr:glycosyltransferase family 39 protein [Anaerolineae bacterium]
MALHKHLFKQTRTPTAFRTFWLLIALIVAAFAVRLYGIENQSIWFDEGWSAYAANRPTLIEAAFADATNPPLYYLLLNSFTRLSGDSVLSLRWVSLAFGVLVVPLAYQLGRRTFGENAGRYAALLTTFSPLLWWASQEARMYTLLAVLVLIAALAWHELLRGHESKRVWLTLLGAELALLYAHNTGPVAALWLNAVTLCAWLIRRDFQRPNSGRWVERQIVVGMLWLPYLLLRFLSLLEANSALVRRPQLNAEFLSRLWQAFWAGPWEMVGREAAINGLSVVLFVLAVSGILATLIRARHVATLQKRWTVGWFVLHVVLLIGGVVVGLSLLGNELHGRYLVMAAPLLLVLIGAGIASLPALLQYAAAGVFVGSFALAVILAQNPLYQHDDVRGMVQHYADTLSADDTVVAWSYADRYDLRYYWDRLGVQARLLILPEGINPFRRPLGAVTGPHSGMLWIDLPQSGDVDLNIWFTQRADYRGMVTCLLGRGTTRLPTEFTTYGMSSLHYREPQLIDPVMQQTDIVFEDANAPLARIYELEQMPSMRVDQGLCLPIGLQLLRDTDADLKAALIARNSLGWEVAQVDAVFATTAQQVTSDLNNMTWMWPWGGMVNAYPLLRLPYGAPPGDYEILLRIYDEQFAPSGYDPVRSDTGVGKDYSLGMWTTVGGAEWLETGRETQLAERVNLPISDDLTLLAIEQGANAPISTFNGDVLRLSLLWEGTDALPDLTLIGANEAWRVTVPANLTSHDDVTLDWREIRIPPDAESGVALLTLPDGTIIGRYDMHHIPAQFEPPVFATPVDAELPSIGVLTGFTLESESFRRDAPVPVTLIWRASAAAETSYTVFVQLVSADGQVIAQSDSLPNGGVRPTTGWRDGEYITDGHELQFNGATVPGPATLIAGMYDAQSGQRLRFADGADFVVLDEGIEVL